MNNIYGFSEKDAARISQAVKGYEAVNRSGNKWYDYRSSANQIIIGKTTAAWAKGTKASVDVYVGDPLEAADRQAEALNLFADIAEDKWVALLGGYLISAEC